MRAASLSAALSSPRVGLTFASQRAHRLKAIIVFCHSTGCRRSDAICFDAFSNRIVIPDIAPLLKCSACGGSGSLSGPTCASGTRSAGRESWGCRRSHQMEAGVLPLSGYARCRRCRAKRHRAWVCCRIRSGSHGSGASRLPFALPRVTLLTLPMPRQKAC
jgi:hypothetical protein